MKIVFYHNLPSGGGMRVVQGFASELAARGHQVEVWAPSTSAGDFLPFPPSVKRVTLLGTVDGSPIWGRLMPRSHRKLLETALMLRELRRTARDVAARMAEAACDVVFVHACRHTAAPVLLSHLDLPSAYYGAEPLRGLYEPAVSSSEKTGGQGWARRLNDMLVRTVLRRMLRGAELRSVQSADLLLTNSCYSREVLWRSYGLFARVSYPGVDTTLFSPGPRAGDGGYLLSVGRLVPLKGHHFVVEALGRIPERRRPALLIVADEALPASWRRLAELARTLGVRLDVRSGVGEAELTSLYSEALLLAYAPIMEPLGLAPLEAMACGIPVVGVREGGIRETVVHGETGLLTERDPGEFAEAVEGLLLDKAARLRMGENGIEHVASRWTWKRSVDQLEICLSSLSRSRAARASG